MPTKLKRISVNVPADLEKIINDLRTREPYKSMSLSETMIALADKGLAAEAAQNHA